MRTAAAVEKVVILAPPNLTGAWILVNTPESGPPDPPITLDVTQGWPSGKFCARDRNDGAAFYAGEVFTGSKPADRPPYPPTLRGTVISFLVTKTPDFGTDYAAYCGLYHDDAGAVDGFFVENNNTRPRGTFTLRRA